jgi:hypothetical protein
MNGEKSTPPPSVGNLMTRITQVVQRSITFISELCCELSKDPLFEEFDDDDDDKSVTDKASEVSVSTKQTEAQKQHVAHVIVSYCCHCGNIGHDQHDGFSSASSNIVVNVVTDINGNDNDEHNDDQILKGSDPGVAVDTKNENCDDQPCDDGGEENQIDEHSNGNNNKDDNPDQDECSVDVLLTQPGDDSDEEDQIDQHNDDDNNNKNTVDIFGQDEGSIDVLFTQQPYDDNGEEDGIEQHNGDDNDSDPGQDECPTDTQFRDDRGENSHENNNDQHNNNDAHDITNTCDNAKGDEHIRVSDDQQHLVIGPANDDDDIFDFTDNEEDMVIVGRII